MVRHHHALGWYTFRLQRKDLNIVPRGHDPIPNTDVKLLRDKLAKVIGIVGRHGRTIRGQGDQLVWPALERDWAVLKMETVGAEMSVFHRIRILRSGNATQLSRGRPDHRPSTS